MFNYKLSPKRQQSPEVLSSNQLTIDKSLDCYNITGNKVESVNDERVLMSSEKDILHAVNSFTSKITNDIKNHSHEDQIDLEKKKQIFN